MKLYDELKWRGLIKDEAREFVNAGSITINEEKIQDENYIVNDKLAIDNEILVLKRGKKKYFIGTIKH